MRVREKFTLSDVEFVVQRAVELSEAEQFTLYKSIANCLSRFLRNGKEEAVLIKEKVSALKNDSAVSKKYIFNEVNQELSFLGIN